MFFRGAKVLVRLFMRLYYRITIDGQENIPAEGGCVLCINHTSLWDPPVLMAMLERQIFFIAKEELFHHPFLSWLLPKIGTVPIKRDHGDVGAIKSALRVIKSGRVLGIFPSGRRVLPGQKATVKAGVALIATMSKAPVIPIYLDAVYRPFHKVHIIIGEPMDFSAYDGRRLETSELKILANEMYGHIMALKPEGKGK